jgi:prepilin-type N-terminal cleavage/methylation domain-containing protein
MVMRRGFTLIELLISLALFSLIAVFLVGGIDQIRLMHSFYAQKGEQFTHHERIRSLLFRDLAQTDTLKKIEEDADHTIMILEPTGHTLYGIALPTVIWMIIRRDNTLIRLESSQPIQIPLDPSKLYGIHKDVIATGCTTFRMYESVTGRFAALLCDNHEIMVEAPR